jgi:hypothetical protein
MTSREPQLTLKAQITKHRTGDTKTTQSTLFVWCSEKFFVICDYKTAQNGDVFNLVRSVKRFEQNITNEQ